MCNGWVIVFFKRYAEYKNEFISTQKKAFFEQNKTEDW